MKNFQKKKSRMFKKLTGGQVCLLINNVEKCSKKVNYIIKRPMSSSTKKCKINKF